MEIDYLALSKQKARRLFMTYMMVIQFFFTVIGLSILGYVLGDRIQPDTNLSVILTAVGLAVGVFVGFITLYQMMKSEERYERRIRH